MSSVSDEEIVELICSENQFERERGILFFEKKYKTIVIGWAKRQKKGVEPEEVWAEAVLTMVYLIFRGKYEKREEATLHTFFYTIYRRVWYHLYQKLRGNLSIYELPLDAFQEKGVSPEDFAEAYFKRKQIDNCLEKMSERNRAIFLDFFEKGYRNKELVERYALKNENNSKQLVNKLKNQFKQCLERYFGYGK